MLKFVIFRKFLALIFHNNARNISIFGSTILLSPINKIVKSDLGNLNFQILGKF